MCEALQLSGAQLPHPFAAPPPRLVTAMAEPGRADGTGAGLSESALRGNFWWMGTWFALNHGAVTTPLVVATTLLGKDVANFSNATLYLATLVSALFLGAPLVGKFGPKGGLLFGMFLYCLYVAGFSLAALFKDVKALTWIFFMGGSLAGGLAAGVLWPAQGVYFARTASLIAQATGQERMQVTAGLAGNFAWVYLMLEVGSKLAFSGLQALDIPPWVIGVLFLVLGAVSFAMMTLSLSLSSSDTSNINVCTKVLAASALWKDPVTWMLSPTNLTFGFCAAFMNGYVNSQYASQELGKAFVPFLAAVTALTAAMLAKVYGRLAEAVGKGIVLVIGSCCFFGIPLCFFALNCCGGWGWALIALYLLQGSGRAVYESTNRAVFSDFFTGAQTEGAFANCMLQSSLSFAASFFLQSALSGTSLAAIVMVLAVLVPVGFGSSRALQNKRQKEASLNAPLDGRGVGA